MKNLNEKIAVPAKRTRVATDGLEEDVVVQISVYEDHEDGYTLRIVEGGVTGYESYCLDENTVDRNMGRDWIACMGTKGRWDRLVVPWSSMKTVYEYFDVRSLIE